MKALGEMLAAPPRQSSGRTAQKMDVVIQEITPEAVTFMRQQRDHVVTETIPIADIATIKKASLEEDEHDVEGVDRCRGGVWRARRHVRRGLLDGLF